MAPSTKKAGKKEKVFHPSSRKARQLNRKVVRSEKLRSLRKERIEKQGNDANIYAFFYHLLPEEGALTLEELHELVRDVWLVRREEELAAEIAARRPGRPKSKRQIELEDEKAREWEEYRTGLEVIDLTHEPTVEVFRRWDQKEVAYIDLLRFVRIFGTEPDRMVVSRPGKHPSIIASNVGEDVMDLAH